MHFYYFLFVLLITDGVDAQMKRRHRPTSSLQYRGNDSRHHIERAVHQELLLVKREAIRFNIFLSVLKREGYTIKGFYHVSTFRNHWADVVREQLQLLDGRRKLPPKGTDDTAKDATMDPYLWEYSYNHHFASLLKASQGGLYLNIAAKHTSVDDDLRSVKKVIQSANLTCSEKIDVHYNVTIPRWTYYNANSKQKLGLSSQTNPRLSEGEYSTIKALQQYCHNYGGNSDKALVFYLHNKGSCCIRDRMTDLNGTVWIDNPEAGWRESMNAFTIEFPSICLQALTEHDYSTCGIENHFGIYAGNFWWARCSHIRLLPRLSDRFDSYEVERLIFNVSSVQTHRRRFAYRCGYSALRCARYHYNVDCHRDAYRGRLVDYVFGQQLLETTAYKNTKSNDTLICRQLRNSSTPYLQREIVIT
jgi:hypothetical protein